jgi:VanZ family protein
MPRILVAARIGAFFLWTSSIIWLSLTSHPPRLPIGFLNWDKAQHALAYALLALLGGWTFGIFFRTRVCTWLTAFIFAVIFGGMLEIAQGLFTTVRTPDLADLFADAIGAGIVCLLVATFLFFRDRLGRRG